VERERGGDGVWCGQVREVLYRLALGEGPVETPQVSMDTFTVQSSGRKKKSVFSTGVFSERETDLWGVCVCVRGGLRDQVDWKVSLDDSFELYSRELARTR